jgi:hypothetical protein
MATKKSTSKTTTKDEPRRAAYAHDKYHLPGDFGTPDPFDDPGRSGEILAVSENGSPFGNDIIGGRGARPHSLSHTLPPPSSAAFSAK